MSRLWQPRPLRERLLDARALKGQFARLVDPYRFSTGGGGTPVTWNPADKDANIALSSGDLVAAKFGGVSAQQGVRATAGIASAASGYFEIEILGVGVGGTDSNSGLELLTANISDFVGSDAFGWGYYFRSGLLLNGGSNSAYGAGITTGDVLGVAFKAGKLWFAKNNTYQAGGNPAAGTAEAFSGLSGTLYPATALSGASDSIRGRFKASAFIYAPPAGFNPWDPT